MHTPHTHICVMYKYNNYNIVQSNISLHRRGSGMT